MAGDFNGDGHQDLAIAGGAFSSVMLMLGNGSGVFTAVSGTFVVGSTPEGLVAGDFNGDGILDLATANFSSNNVSVLLGGVVPTQSILSSTSPMTVVAGATVPLTLTASDIGTAFNAPTGTVAFFDGSTSVGTASQTSSPYTFSTSGLSAGTHNFSASYPGDTRSSGSTSNTFTFTVLQSQTISFAPLNPVAVGVAPFNISATASSGLTVSFASNLVSICTVNSSTVTILAAGTCSITASQAGDSVNYAAATPITRTFTVAANGSQTITFDALPNQIIGISPFPIAAQSSALLPVTFTSTTSPVCVTASGLVTLLSTGTCSIAASQGGGARGFSAATPVTRSFTVSRATPSGASFTPVESGPFTAGANPFSVAVGDFNGDGKPDFATANFDGSSVTVMLGDGLGGFAAAPGSPLPGGISSIGVAVGDFNGDGFQDLALANFTSANVTVLLGDGQGAFAPAPGSPFVVGTSPQYIAVGDFNGDGIQDLVTPNFGSSTVTVLLGNGAGGFAPSPGSPVAVGSSPIAVVVGDFNRDGIQDIATANYEGNSLTVLLGNGSGGFSTAPGSPVAVGASPTFLSAGDFNGDGITDLAATDGSSGTVSVLLGNGLGGFSPAPNSPFSVGSEPFSLAVADLNGDGISDLVASNYGSGTFTALLGNGLGGFAPGSPVTVGPSPLSLAVADFNRDGIEDVVIAFNTGSSNAAVLLGGGAAAGGSPVITTTSLPAGTVGIAYSQTLVASGGVSPYKNWTVVSASLPPGLLLNSATGVIAGTPSSTTGSPFSFSITVQDNANNTSAAQSLSIAIQLQNQTITFAPLSSVNLGVAPFTITATATSGQTVSLTTTTSTVCTVSGSTVTIVGGGTCSITASQAGNTIYSAAPSVSPELRGLLGNNHRFPGAVAVEQCGSDGTGNHRLGDLGVLRFEYLTGAQRR